MPDHATQDYYYHGKLLLTGEYFVLDGATALAVPTKLGQRFRVSTLEERGPGNLQWNIYRTRREDTSRHWLSLPAGEEATDRDDPVRDGLYRLLAAAERLRPGSTKLLHGKRVNCYLEFDETWGLGSSSTLVAFLGEYLEVDPYALLAGWFGGSGYDIACARADGPLRYRRVAVGLKPTVVPVDWQPDWLGQTYFVHRNQKQNSREGIRAYRVAKKRVRYLEVITKLTQALLISDSLTEALNTVFIHESVVARTLGLPSVQQELFPDFPGRIKSLGAWGGDFVWALSEEPTEKVRAYFNERGYPTFIPYHDMVL